MAPHVFVWDYMPTSCCYFEYMHDGLSNFIIKITYQRIVFTTAYCITKPVTKPHSHYKYFRGQASKCASILSNISVEHLVFAVAFSMTTNLFECCSPVDMLFFPEKLGHREIAYKFYTLFVRFIPCICLTIITLFVAVYYTFTKNVLILKAAYEPAILWNLLV
jgi:hypothetical protein